MKFYIGDNEYNLMSLEDLTLQEILEVRRQTGMTMAEVTEQLANIDVGNILAMDEASLVALAVLVWQARRQAGERSLTIEQACDFPLAQMRVETEDDDQADEAPAGNRAARRARATGPAKTSTAKKGTARKTTSRGRTKPRTSATPSNRA